MISKRTAKRYCKDYQLIENYEVAVNDKTQMWDCHHKRETDENKSKKQLISEGRYYDVSPDELIFLTKSEHSKLHKPSAETKQKISENHNHSPYSGSPKKPVQCVETGEVFDSLTDAARHYNLFYGNIRKCCNGKLKTTGKLHWTFI